VDTTKVFTYFLAALGAINSVIAVLGYIQRAMDAAGTAQSLWKRVQHIFFGRPQRAAPQSAPATTVAQQPLPWSAPTAVPAQPALPSKRRRFRVAHPTISLLVAIAYAIEITGIVLLGNAGQSTVTLAGVELWGILLELAGLIMLFSVAIAAAVQASKMGRVGWIVANVVFGFIFPVGLFVYGLFGPTEKRHSTRQDQLVTSPQAS
jgi:hypothetical protein